MRRIVIASLCALLIAPTTAGALDASDAEPPRVDSLEILSPMPTAENPFIITEIQVSDDKNWTTVARLDVDVSFAIPAGVIPTCATNNLVHIRTNMIELHERRTTDTGRHRQVFWHLMTVAPRTFIKALPAGCPEWRTTDQLNTPFSVTLSDEAGRTLNKFLPVPAMARNAIDTALNLPINIGSCIVGGIKYRLATSKESLLSKLNSLEAISGSTRADLSAIRTGVNPTGEWASIRDRLLAVDAALQLDLAVTRFQLNPTVEGAAKLPLCPLTGNFPFGVSPFVEGVNVRGDFANLGSQLKAYLSSVPTPKQKQARNTTLTCVKGKTTKKVTGSKCPKGYTLRK